MTYDILVYGPIFCDLIFTGLPTMPTLGTELFADEFTVTIGGSAIVAAGLHKLGARTGLIADLGNDPLSDIVRRLLDDLGVDRSLIREHPYPLPQVTVGLSFPADRAFVTRFQRPDHAPDLPTILRRHSAKHLHVCSFLAALETPEAATVAHAAGMTVSMDPGWDEVALHDPKLAAMVAELDLFLPNRAELCHIARTEDVALAVSNISATMQHGIVILKQGAEGATAFDIDGTERVYNRALPVTPIDTTGAGDAFDAGFLYAHISGQPIETCMRYGAVCGGLSTTRPGGIDALPTFKEMTAWLSRLPS